MVREQIQARGVHDEDVLRAMRKVPRHLFVDSPDAYADLALPLPDGQTISQPYVVAAMTQAARPSTRGAAATQNDGWHGANVLEVGTGSGYQAAVLAELGVNVTSIERHAALSERARRRLRATGYEDRVTLVVGDGTRGYPENAPYDAIVVTAAGPSVPQPLLEQLRSDGGRLVMPVGTREHQAITLIERQGSELLSHRLEPVAFVPLLGDFGFPEE
jgi:protein-L-isoaspartate(D-aspartate) O-methyltransferase